MPTIDPKQFHQLSRQALRSIDDQLGELELDQLDINLADDVLTLEFERGGTFIINAHSAALQIWLAAGHQAWHFDFDFEKSKWIASKNGDELMSTLANVLSDKLGEPVKL